MYALIKFFRHFRFQPKEKKKEIDQNLISLSFSVFKTSFGRFLKKKITFIAPPSRYICLCAAKRKGGVND